MPPDEAADTIHLVVASFAWSDMSSAIADAVFVDRVEGTLASNAPLRFAANSVDIAAHAMRTPKNFPSKNDRRLIGCSSPSPPCRPSISSLTL